jgi:hypothetical protein
MQKHRYWQGALETAWQQTCRRETAIRSLIEAGPVSHAQADVLAKDLGISRSLVLQMVHDLAAKRRISLRFNCKNLATKVT